ncbi:MAG: AIPR family protein [Alphaproteobacteria bacterium]|nr:AIPR family protein [Alphaproteobacteria bacterium]
MEIADYHADLLASVASRSEAAGLSWREGFVTEMLERLRDGSEVPDAEVCIEQLNGPKNRRLLIDAYAEDEADNSLHLFVCLPHGEKGPPVLIPSEARDQGFVRLRNFLDAAQAGWVRDNIEESRPAWALAQLIRRRNFSAVRLHILTDRPLSERLKSIPDDTTEDGAVITFQIWDLTRLKRIHDALSVRDDLEVDLSECGGGGLKALRATNGDEDYDAYLGVIAAEDLARIYIRYGSRLLEGNVRTFLGRRGNVNKGIQKTLNEEPSRFFAYNNGIAATASGVEMVEDGNGVLVTKATDLQIVNGAQTTASLASALRDKKLPEGNVYVPVKLSVVSTEAAEELIPLISRYANSQNAVRQSDFFANHPFHRRVEEMSRRLLAPATDGSQVQTHWYYERARGQYLNDQAGLTSSQKSKFVVMNPKKQVITKTDLAKVETCFALLPDTACRGAEKAFIEFAKTITDLWKDEQRRAEFTDDWFKSAVAHVILFRLTEKIVSGAEWYEGGYRAQIVAYACARMAKLASEVSDGGRLDYRRIWGLQGVDAAFKRQIDLTAETMSHVLRSPPREGQNIGEWAKQQACRSMALGTDVEIVRGFEAWGVDKHTARTERREQRAVGAIDEDLRAMETVLQTSPEVWDSLRHYARARRLLGPRDEAALSAACLERGRPPNENQAQALIALLKRAEDTGWVPPQ